MTTSSPGSSGGSLQLDIETDGHTREQWERAAAAVLRKARRLRDDDADSLAWDKLARTTLDGIRVTPLGSAADLEGLATAGRPARSGPWDVRTYAAAADERTQHDEALADLQGGATSAVAARDRRAPTSPPCSTGCSSTWRPWCSTRVTTALAAARAFLAYAGGRALHPHTNLGLDARAATAEAAALAQRRRRPRLRGRRHPRPRRRRLRGPGAGLRDGRRGRLPARPRGRRGARVEQAAALVEFRFAATDEQFLTIAKVRAARRLLGPDRSSCPGSAPVEQRQHVVTSRPMMSSFDPYANMLRTTVAAFGAGVGGADAVTVLPFDSPLGRPDDFGRRIARNTSALLIAESHVAAVSDPAGGAYAVEKLTDDLAAAAWAELGRIEEEGLDALASRVEAVAAERDLQVAKRSRPITGLSEFPNLGEERPTRPPYDDWARVRSYGAAFEALRDAPADAHVFLATMGTVAEHTARATFATNLFAAGGVAVDLGGPSAGPDDVLAAYDGQPVVCLAGPDPAYAEWGADLVAALRAAGRHPGDPGREAG